MHKVSKEMLSVEDFLVIWLSNISILSVPDEGYSGNWSCTLILIFIPTLGLIKNLASTEFYFFSVFGFESFYCIILKLK